MARNSYSVMKGTVSDGLHAGDTTTPAGDWINSAIDVIHRRTEHEMIKVVGTLATVVSTQEYNFTDISSDVQRILWMRIRDNNQYLDEVSEQELAMIDPNELDNESKPDLYYVRDQTIGLYPVPDAVYSVDVRYLKRHVEMTADDDVPDLGVEWTDVITDGARMFGWQYLKGEGSQEFANSKMVFEKGIEDMLLNKDKKVNQRHRMSPPSSFVKRHIGAPRIEQ